MDDFYKMLIWSFRWCWLGKEQFRTRMATMSYKGAGDDLCVGFFCDLENAHQADNLPNPTANACCDLELEHIYSAQSWLARGLTGVL